MLRFWKRVYLPYIILIASPSVCGKCSSFCTYGVWSDWTCKCNNPNQTRTRSMCCPEGPTSAEECASVCNITLHYREEAPCTTCKNGGVFDQHSGRCKCPPTYSGTICCVHCNGNPCKHGTCNDTASPFFCQCKPGFTGSVCDQKIKSSSTPAWIPYLEYSLIALAGILLLVTISCVSVKVVCAYKRSKKKKEEDITHQNKDGAIDDRRNSKSNSIMPKSNDS